MTLGEIISLLFPAAKWREDYETTLRPEHPDGETIDKWNAAKLGPQPTAATLRGRAAEAEAAKVKAAKRAALTATDAGVIRGVDDLFAALSKKGLLSAADVPELAAKLDARAALRAKVAAAVIEK
mgnify:CR=1 FL=1